MRIKLDISHLGLTKKSSPKWVNNLSSIDDTVQFLIVFVIGLRLVDAIQTHIIVKQLLE